MEPRDAVPAGGGRRRRQEKIGVVISDAMTKTVVVEVQRVVVDPLYRKYVRRRSRFMAHDEKDECKVGDRVRIEETRPLSRRKRWRVRAILERAAAETR